MTRSLSLALLALLSVSTHAAEWAIEPSVEARATFTDNINLEPGVRENTPGWLLYPRVTFARRTEVTEISGKAGLGINRYPGHSDLDTEDANFLVNSKLSAERSQYGLTAGFIRDSTLTCLHYFAHK